MSEQLVITALGEDRPGLVNALSHELYKYDLNIEDSRMSVLGGEFVVMLLVSGSLTSIDQVVQSVAKLEEMLNMKLLTKKTRSKQDTAGLIPYKVEVVSIDHPGIVQDIASFFSAREINVVDMDTTCYPAAHTGTPMFSLYMTIGMPAGQSIANLREEFIQNCDEKNLDAKMDALV